jgi:hypothetical protein
MRHVTAVAVILAAAFCSAVRAQDLEPRAYSNSPTGLNFLITGYGYATGTVLTDPALPLENVTNDAHFGFLAYARSLNIFSKSAKIDVAMPFGSLFAKGTVFGQPAERFVVGLGEPSFRFSINLIGAPALTAAEFKNYHQDLILGASLRIIAPLGQYDIPTW